MIRALLAVLVCSAAAAAGPDDDARAALALAEAQTVRARLDSLEARVAALEGAAAPSQPLAAAPVRADLGHTHTCSKGHTWNHAMDGGTHRCPVCGEAQFVVDPVPRPTSLVRSSPGCGPNGCPTPSVQNRPLRLLRR